MPRDLWQAAGFLLGLASMLWLSPLALRASPSLEAGHRDQLEAALHHDVNRVREDRHLIPLVRMPELDAVARAHSHDMARRQYLSHESPEGNNPVHRLSAGGIQGFSLAAENIGLTSRSEPTREIVEGWLNSSDHRQNLHAPAFNATGIGVARRSDGSLIYTQLYLTLSH